LGKRKRRQRSLVVVIGGDGTNGADVGVEAFLEGV
jgi:molybdopterin biosynthesis enzyme MoaB